MSLIDTIRNKLGIEQMKSDIQTALDRSASNEQQISDLPTADEVEQIVQRMMDENSTSDSGDDSQTGSTAGYPGDGSEPKWYAQVGAFYEKPSSSEIDKSNATTVENADQFVDAISTDDELVWVPNDVTIDLTGLSDVGVGDGVTIASGRDVPNGVRGGTLRVDDFGGDEVLRCYGDDVRITGLQIEGPTTDHISYDDGKERAFGMFMGANNVFDNCEVYGWPFAGFIFGGRSYTPSYTVRHCHFHDNLMEGLGYGLELYNGHHTIHHNYFDRCRHAISSFGYEDNGYEAYHNVVGPEPLSHAFDMHCQDENLDNGSMMAGDTIDIHDNVFLFTTDIEGRGQEAVAIRGYPKNRCDIDDNHFKHGSKPSNHDVQGNAYRQDNVDSWTNMYASGNTFGTDLDYQLPDQA